MRNIQSNNVLTNQAVVSYVNILLDSDKEEIKQKI